MVDFVQHVLRFIEAISLVAVQHLHLWICWCLLRNYTTIIIVFILLLLLLLHCFPFWNMLLFVCCVTDYKFIFIPDFVVFLMGAKLVKREKLLHVIIFALLTLCIQVVNGKVCTCLCVCAYARELESGKRMSTWKEVLIKQKASTSNHHRIFHVLCAFHRKPYLLIHNLFAFVHFTNSFFQGMERAWHIICSTRSHLRWFFTRLIQHVKSFIFEHSTILLFACVCMFEYFTAQHSAKCNAEMHTQPCYILYH